MTGRKLMVAAICVAAVSVAASAHAQQAKPPLQLSPSTSFTVRDAFAPDPNQWGPQAGRRSLQWDSKTARWGLKLDLDQRVGRPLSFTDRDIQAGAFYKITPSFRLGGSVSLGAMDQSPQQALIPADKAPKVRLETALKF
jgi:hypothetical protein